MMQFHDGYCRAMVTPADENRPGWTLALRKLYHALADETVPSDFGDLMTQIERKSSHGSSIDDCALPGSY